MLGGVHGLFMCFVLFLLLLCRHFVFGLQEFTFEAPCSCMID